MKNIVLIALALIALIGCNHPKGIYVESGEFKNEVWMSNEPIYLNIEIDQSDEYEMTLNVRHTIDYEFANMWCFVTLRDSAHVILRDTLNIPIAAEDGRWLGQGNSLISVSTLLHKKAVLIQGRYEVEIVQGMRCNALNGVKNVSVILSNEREGK